MRKFLVVYMQLDHAIGWEMGASLGQGLEALGHEVYYTGLNHETSDVSIKEICDDLNPEAVIVVDTHDEYNLSGVQAKKIFWSVDTHVLGHRKHIDYINKYNIDYVLCSSQRDPKIFLTHTDANALWFPNAANIFKQKKLYLPKIHDVGFCGTEFPNRKWMYDADWIHCERKLHPEMVKAINGYKVSINQSISYDINARVFETMACGTILLTNKMEGIENLLGESVYYFTSSDEAKAQADKILSMSDDEREYKARKTMDFCKREHSYIARANLLCGII